MRIQNEDSYMYIFYFDKVYKLTAHNSKSKTPRDQTSVLGPEGKGASSCDGSLG